MAKTRSEYIVLARKQVGVTSGNTYRNWYNKTVGNLGNSKWPYCAAGLGWNAAQIGMTSSEYPFTASAPTMLNWFKNKGRFYKRGTYTPKQSDTIIFKWLDNYSSLASHVGLVESVSGGYVTTIEYNSTNGNVCRRTWALNNVCIVGYGVPYFAAGSNTPTNGKESIKAVQRKLNSTYKTHCTIDGYDGSQTKSALVGSLQVELNKLGAKLRVDGVWGTATKVAVAKYCNLRKGDKGALVYLLQGALICKGYDTGGFDGIFGDKTLAAVKAYQKANGLTIDGISGKNTFEKLLK